MSRAVVLVLVLSLSARVASAAWNTQITHKRSDRVQLRVLSTGGVISVATSSQKNDTPAIFRFDNQDDFLPITLTASDGQTHSMKIELKRNHETTLTITYTAEAKPAQKSARVSKFIGRITNSHQNCSAAGDKWNLRADFLAADQSVLLSKTVNLSTTINNVELPAGKYVVRVYRWDAGSNAFIYHSNSSVEVNADGWELVHGCALVLHEGVLSNASQTCPGASGRYRAEVYLGNTLVTKTPDLEKGYETKLKLAAGTYQVRWQRNLQGTLWTYQSTTWLTVGGPSWRHAFTCKR